MVTSDFVHAMDAIQLALRPRLKVCGYRCKGRVFNRKTDDGLVQVVKFWLAPANPPAWTEIPGLRENYYGFFKVELGVYVPEVARWHIRTEAKSWVQETLCCIRTGLSDDCGAKEGRWWPADATDVITSEVMSCLEQSGLPFLERYSTRNKILSEWQFQTKNSNAGNVPRIVRAIIHWERGESETARKLLAEQYADARNRHPGHAEYVCRLADQLGLGALAV